MRLTGSDWLRSPRQAHRFQMDQTISVNEPSSADRPSAGRAVTPEILNRLARQWVGFVTPTLHTDVSSLGEGESPYEAAYSVPPRTPEVVPAGRATGG